MNTILLISLLVADFLLLVLFLKQRSSVKVPASDDINEERLILEQMRSKVEGELSTLHLDAKKMLAELSKLATFMEMEKDKEKETMRIEMQELTDEFQRSIEATLEQIDDYTLKLHQSKKATDASLLRCKKEIAKGEMIIEALADKLPFHEIVQKINSKRLEEVRHLLTKGKSSEEVAAELNIPIDQVNLVRTTSVNYSL